MAKGLIYFVSWEDDLDHVKIGYTTGLQKRLSDLLIANWRCLVMRKVLLTTLGKEGEFLLHRQFAQQRIAGEWFQMDSAIVDFEKGKRCCHMEGQGQAHACPAQVGCGRQSSRGLRRARDT